MITFEREVFEMSTIYRASTSDKALYSRAVSRKTRRTRKVQRRERISFLRRKLIFLAAILFVAAVVVFGSKSSAFAKSGTNEAYPYYKNIVVGAGETLWSIAEDYHEDAELSVKEYVNELLSLNGLSRDTVIRQGQELIVVYYSPEYK